MSGYIDDLFKYFKTKKEKVEKEFSVKKPMEKPIEVLTEKTEPKEQRHKPDQKQELDQGFLVKKQEEKSIEFLTKKLLDLLGRIRVEEKKVLVIKQKVRHKDKTYTYIRKRIELPPDYNSDIVYVISKYDFQKMIQALNEFINAL